MRRTASVRKDKPVNAHLLCEFVKRVALYEFRTSICKETLAFTRKMIVNNMSYDSIKDGIAEKFESFVIHRFPFTVPTHNAFMHQSQLIITDVARIKTDNPV